MTRLSVLLAAFTCAATANEIPQSLAIRAIVGEASGEGPKGMLAVAGAIRNRGTLQGVYGVNAAHVDLQPAWVWSAAKRAWAESRTNDLSRGATHWEGTAFKRPTWAAGMTVTTVVNHQRFYK